MLRGLGALGVLVVDDSAEMRTIIGTVLAAVGVRNLHYAGDGRQGLDVILDRPIDIAYVDCEMPVMNGLDFISRVRSLDSRQQYLPIIMVTGHSDLYHLNMARERGVTEFLAKPVTTISILNRLDEVILRPRPFVRTSNFFGPDRRRRRADDYDGPMRRKTDVGPVVEF
jgi:CheY-like chemotaxis protein